MCQHPSPLFSFDRRVVPCARCGGCLHALCLQPGEGAEPVTCPPCLARGQEPEGTAGATVREEGASVVRRVPTSYRGGVSRTGSATPRPLPRTPMSDAWSRALSRDRQRQEQEERAQHDDSKP